MPEPARSTHRNSAPPRSAVLCVAAVLALVGLTGQANSESTRAMDHDEVREAVLEGRLAPLDTVLGAVRNSFELQIVDVRALTNDQAYLFEVLILEADGAILQLYYDGRTAKLVGWTGVGSEDGSEYSAFVEEIFARLLDAQTEGQSPQ